MRLYLHNSVLWSHGHPSFDSRPAHHPPLLLALSHPSANCPCSVPSVNNVLLPSTLFEGVYNEGTSASGIGTVVGSPDCAGGGGGGFALFGSPQLTSSSCSATAATHRPRTNRQSMLTSAAAAISSSSAAALAGLRAPLPPPSFFQPQQQPSSVLQNYYQNQAAVAGVLQQQQQQQHPYASGLNPSIAASAFGNTYANAVDASLIDQPPIYSCECALYLGRGFSVELNPKSCVGRQQKLQINEPLHHTACTLPCRPSK